jgi:hypothetical protein
MPREPKLLIRTVSYIVQIFFTLCELLNDALE